jgi:protein tyrosine phosphatase
MTKQLQRRLSNTKILFFCLQNDTVRNIKLFHFLGWPETGVPKTGEGIIDLIGQVQRVSEQQEEDGPVTVHCRSVHFK